MLYYVVDNAVMTDNVFCNALQRMAVLQWCYMEYKEIVDGEDNKWSEVLSSE